VVDAVGDARTNNTAIANGSANGSARARDTFSFSFSFTPPPPPPPRTTTTTTTTTRIATPEEQRQGILLRYTYKQIHHIRSRLNSNNNNNNEEDEASPGGSNENSLNGNKENAERERRHRNEHPPIQNDNGRGCRLDDEEQHHQQQQQDQQSSRRQRLSGNSNELREATALVQSLKAQLQAAMNRRERCLQAMRVDVDVDTCVQTSTNTRHVQSGGSNTGGAGDVTKDEKETNPTTYSSPYRDVGVDATTIAVGAGKKPRHPETPTARAGNSNSIGVDTESNKRASETISEHQETIPDAQMDAQMQRDIMALKNYHRKIDRGPCEKNETNNNDDDVNDDVISSTNTSTTSTSPGVILPGARRIRNLLENEVK